MEEAIPGQHIRKNGFEKEATLLQDSRDGLIALGKMLHIE